MYVCTACFHIEHPITRFTFIPYSFIFIFITFVYKGGCTLHPWGWFPHPAYVPLIRAFKDHHFNLTWPTPRIALQMFRWNAAAWSARDLLKWSLFMWICLLHVHTHPLAHCMYVDIGTRGEVINSCVSCSIRNYISFIIFYESWKLFVFVRLRIVLLVAVLGYVLYCTFYLVINLSVFSTLVV